MAKHWGTWQARGESGQSESLAQCGWAPSAAATESADATPSEEIPLRPSVASLETELVSPLSVGFGAVWSAHHNRTDQDVAIKVLSVDRGSAHEGAVERFLREVKITASLRHPNTIRVFDFGGGDNGIPLYLVMERLHGPNVEDVLRAMRARRRVMSERAAIDIALAILGSLAEAHEHGLVHRDLKPGNVMLNQVSGNVPVVKVLDFGCSYVRGSTLTDKGAVFGTLGYMSPEQIRGNDVDHRSDIFSLGLILFRAITGEMPFSSTNNVTLLYQYASTDVPDPRDVTAHQITDDFAAIINQALHRDRDKRFATSGAMRTALLDVIPQVRRRPAFTDSEMNSPLRRTEVPESLPRASGELGALVRVAMEREEAEGGPSSALHTESATGLFDGQTDDQRTGADTAEQQRGSSSEIAGSKRPSRPDAIEAPAGLPSMRDAPRAVAHGGKQDVVSAAEIGGATLDQNHGSAARKDDREKRRGARTGTEPSIPAVSRHAAEKTMHQEIPKLAQAQATSAAAAGTAAPAAVSVPIAAFADTDAAAPEPASPSRWPVVAVLAIAGIGGLIWWAAASASAPVAPKAGGSAAVVLDAGGAAGAPAASTPSPSAADASAAAVDPDDDTSVGHDETPTGDAGINVGDTDRGAEPSGASAAAGKNAEQSAANAEKSAANAEKSAANAEKSAANAGKAKTSADKRNAARKPQRARRTAPKPAVNRPPPPPPLPPPAQARPKLKPAVFDD